MSVKAGLRNFLRQARAAKATISAIRGHRRGRPIAHRDWETILWAHCASNGRFTDFLTPLLRVMAPRRPSADVTGLLGRFTVADQKRIASQIGRDGFYVFENLLPDAFCDAIEDFARKAPTYTHDESGRGERPVIYDPGHPVARLYKIREEDSLANPGVQALMADEALLRISEAYLQTRAVVGGIDTWWSTPYGNGPSSEAAQLFHFDFDAPPRWLKLFVYVTPVGPENGPHVYVRRSHKAAVASAREIVSRGYARIPDADIDRAYGKDASTEIIGPRGTVFLADTRGFHKGKHPTGGDRLICQLIYCSSVFNNHAPPLERLAGFTPAMAATVTKNPDAYARYLKS